jgi:hypothetical protein
VIQLGAFLWYKITDSELQYDSRHSPSSAMSHPVSHLSSQSEAPTTQNAAIGYVSHVQLIVEVSDIVLLGSAPPDALAELKALANIILSSVEQIEAACAANSFTYPSPDSTFTLESEAPRMHPAIQSAGSLITSAAAQLTALVRPAPLSLFDTSQQVNLMVFCCHGPSLMTWPG